MARKFLADVVSVAQDELKRLGFYKSGGTYTSRLNDDAFGWLGLNTIAQRNDGRVGINPVVGVRYVPIETILKELVGTKESSTDPTISTSLGYITPDARYQEWLFEPAPFDYRTEATRMVAAIERYGIPFMRANISLEEIIRNLQNTQFASKDTAVFRLPIAYGLSGKVALAVAHVKEHSKEIESRGDIAARIYKEFASRFLSRFA